jgi:hypothetical protein
MAGLGKAAVLAFGLCAAPSWADEVVIAALGDSLTQGYGLPAEQGFVPQLEAWLQARGHDVRLINAGVSGDTTSGGLARIGWTLTSEVQALIVAATTCCADCRQRSRGPIWPAFWTRRARQGSRCCWSAWRHR